MGEPGKVGCPTLSLMFQLVFGNNWHEYFYRWDAIAVIQPVLVVSEYWRKTLPYYTLYCLCTNCYHWLLLLYISHTHTHNCFTAVWILSLTARVSQCQKVHSPTVHQPVGIKGATPFPSGVWWLIENQWGQAATHCFDTDCCMTRRTSSPWKTHSTNPQRFLLNRQGRMTQWELDNPASFGKQPFNESSSSSSTVYVTGTKRLLLL